MVKIQLPGSRDVNETTIPCPNICLYIHRVEKTEEMRGAARVAFSPKYYSNKHCNGYGHKNFGCGSISHPTSDI